MVVAQWQPYLFLGVGFSLFICDGEFFQLDAFEKKRKRFVADKPVFDVQLVCDGDEM